MRWRFQAVIICLASYQITVLVKGRGTIEAIEKLQKDRNSWVKERQQRLDFINQQLQRERHAEHTFSEVDDAMEAYFIATEKKLPPLRSKPVLSDFYHPSDQQKNNEILFIISSLGLMGYLMYKSK